LNLTPPKVKATLKESQICQRVPYSAGTGSTRMELEEPPPRQTPADVTEMQSAPPPPLV
jgi:hypothetical protein